ncbi:MAG: hypothetical protein ACREJO_11540 [Phycisphaerales bacterium]
MRASCAVPIMVWIAVGAVLNILAAWTCAMLEFKSRTLSFVGDASLDSMPSVAEACINDPAYTSRFPDRRTGLNRWVIVYWTHTTDRYARWFDHETSDSHTYSYLKFGLPFRSLERVEERWSDLTPRQQWGVRREAGMRGGWPFPTNEERSLASWDRSVTHPLPLVPLWLGFMLNTCIYGMLAVGVWLVTTRVARRFCRHVRVGRGLCPRCNYPIGTSPLCTECGEPIPAPRI